MIDRTADELKRWLWSDALALWASVGADPAGGFYEGIDFSGRPWLGGQRLRVQARQIWVYANAHARAPSSGWQEAMQHGLDHLLGPFRRNDGLFHAVVLSNGVALEGPALLYDQAFVLLALAAVHRADPGRSTVRDDASALIRRIDFNYCQPTAGYREADPETPYCANPIMHLLEAIMAWEEIDASGGWAARADVIAEFALANLIDPASGVLREHFDAEWRPAPGIVGRLVEPGHQFEWSWLLRRWGLARGREDAVTSADGLFDLGAAWGVERSRGVTVNTVLDDSSPLDRASRLWPQTEWLKAATTAGRVCENGTRRLELAGQARTAADALQLYLRTAVPGLWQDRLSAEGVFDDAFSPASSLYHIAGAIFEL